MNASEMYLGKFIQAWADYYIALANSPGIQEFVLTHPKPPTEMFSEEQQEYLRSLNKAFQFSGKSDKS